MRTDLRGDPRVRAIVLACFGDDAASWQRHVSCVTGALHALWSLADQYTVDGELKTYTAGGLDQFVGIPGFAKAMSHADVDWLEVRDKCLVIKRFHEHNGQSAKIRDQGARRQARYRDVTEDASPEKRREDKNKTPAQKDDSKSAKGIEIPEALRTPEFLAAWREWEAHLREKKVRTTVRADRLQLAECLTWGVAGAVAAIRYSIRGNYQGLFQARQDAAAGGGQPAAPHESITKPITHGEV